MDNSDDLSLAYLKERGAAPAAARDLASKIKAEYTKQQQAETDTTLKGLIGQGGMVGQLAYVVRTGQQTARLSRNAAFGILSAVEEGAEALYDFGKAGIGSGDNTEQGQAAPLAPSLNEQFPAYAEGMRWLKKSIGAGDSNLDVMTQKAVQFMAPFSLYLKAMGGVSAAAKTAGAVKMAAADAMTMATNFDPHEERFADMLVDMGLDNAYLRYMTDPDETEAEGRFKNVIDSQVVNLGLATGLGAVALGSAITFRALRNPKPVGMNQRGMIAFHGSPHDFDQFNLEKIGTGEGAQAYGHGLYFAESPDVAKQYQKQLAGDVFEVADGQIFDPNSLQHLNVRATVRKGDLSAAIQKAKEIASSNSPVASAAKADLQVLSGLQSRGGIKPASGRLYNVDIPDEAINKMLDWDKPLSEQPGMVQQRIYDSMTSAGFDTHLVNHILNNKTGRDLYNELSGRLNAKNPGPATGAAQASEFLKKAGIPGIRYLDAGSRGAGNGTRNIVLFDDKLAKVVKKE